MKERIQRPHDYVGHSPVRIIIVDDFIANISFGLFSFLYFIAFHREKIIASRGEQQNIVMRKAEHIVCTRIYPDSEGNRFCVFSSILSLTLLQTFTLSLLNRFDHIHY